MLNKLPPAYFTKTQTYGAIQVFYYKQQIIVALQAMFIKEEETDKEGEFLLFMFLMNSVCLWIRAYFIFRV